MNKRTHTAIVQKKGVECRIPKVDIEQFKKAGWTEVVMDVQVQPSLKRGRK